LQHHAAGGNVLFILALLAGCKGGGSEDGCRDVVHPIDLDDPTDLGFTAADVVALAPPGGQVELLWPGTAGTTALTVGFTDAGEARFVDFEQRDPNAECHQRIEVDGTLGFSTADGAFAETFQGVVLTASVAEVAWLDHRFDLEQVRGTYDAATYAPDQFCSDYQSLEGALSASFDAAGSHGGVTGHAECQPDCSGDDCYGRMDTFSVASWGL
jgi:hypothetical protein